MPEDRAESNWTVEEVGAAKPNKGPAQDPTQPPAQIGLPSKCFQRWGFHNAYPPSSFRVHLSVKGHINNVSAVQTQHGVQTALTFFEWYFRENAMFDKESTTWRIILKDGRIINLSVCQHISN